MKYAQFNDQHHYTQDGPQPGPMPAPALIDFKKDQEITRGSGPCPDCGQRASYKTIQPFDPHGNKTPGYYYVIDCDNCEYYEFNYQGPDI